MEIDIPTYLGTVQDVQGATIRIALKQEGTAGIRLVEGHAYRIGQIGSFLRIPIGYTDLYGIVSQVGASAAPIATETGENVGHNWLRLELIGESVSGGPFQRGLSQYPTIGDKVHLVTQPDLAKIYGQVGLPGMIHVGQIAGAPAVPTLVDANKLVTRHSAVVGVTGSGKSTTVAGILRALSDSQRFPSARILILDIHGEYRHALSDRANTFRIGEHVQRDANPLYTPYWAMTFDELIPLTFGDLDERAAAQIAERVATAKREFARQNTLEACDENTITADSPIPFSIHQLWFELHQEVNATHTVSQTAQTEATRAYVLDDEGEPIDKGDAFEVRPPQYRSATQASGVEKVYLSGSQLNIRRQLDTLGARLRDPRYSFLFRPGPWSVTQQNGTDVDLDALLSDWIGNDSPITILDLSGVPQHIVSSLVGVLLRTLYDALFWGRYLNIGGRERPLLLVLEEAHGYLGAEDRRGAAEISRRIVKEGRKYGVGLMLVSQRPAEIDPTILSQCGTVFAMRLTNSTDRSHVRSVTADNLEGLLDTLPILRTGELIVVGESVRLPSRSFIPPPPTSRRPESIDPLVYAPKSAGGWNRATEPANFQSLVHSWRSQNPYWMQSQYQGDLMMDRTPVSSSNIAEVGYSEAEQILEVLFHSGQCYHYFDIPLTVFEEFISAPSKGAYLNDNIKGFYRYAQV